MFYQIINIGKVIDVICRAFSHAYAWIAAILLSACNFFAPEWYCFAVVGFCVLIDGLFGIVVSKRRGGYGISELGRGTVVKVSSYGICLIIVFMIESLIHDDGFFGIKVAAGVAAACELWSISAFVLILKPDFPFFLLFRKQLAGEIARKINRPAEEVIDILNCQTGKNRLIQVPEEK